MCVVCALCVSVLLHSRTSALLHLPDTALPTPVRSHTGSHWSTAPCVPRCAALYRAGPSVLSVWCRTAWCCALHCTVCALLHCCCGQRAVGSVTHCLAARRLWAVELPLCSAALPGGSGQWNSCHTLPLCLGAVGRASPALLCLSAWRQWVLHTSATHCLAAPGQWAVELPLLVLCTAALPGAVGSATFALHCLAAWGQWALGSLQQTVSLPGGSGQWDSCNAPPHCLGAVGSGTPATHRLTAWGQWAVGSLQHTV